MQAQLMKPATPVILTNQSKTCHPELVSFMKPRRPKAAVKATAMWGTPLLVVRLKKLGADPDSARPTRMREPE